MSPTLFPYQAEGVNWLTPRQYSLLFDDMGLGKSPQAIVAAKMKRSKRVLINTQKSLLPNWYHEFHKFWEKGPGPRIATKIEAMADFVNLPVCTAILNFDRFSRDDSWAHLIRDGLDWDVCIIDECQALKNWDAARTRRFYRYVFPKCKSVIALSGTPCPNHFGELYPLLRHMFPDVIKNASGQVMTRLQFEDEYCTTEMKHFGRGRPTRVITGSKNGDKLKLKLAGDVLRRKKEDVLKDLPDKRIELLPLHPSRDEVKELQAFANIAPDDLDDDALFNYLQSDAVHFATMMRMLGLVKASALVPWVQDLLFENNEKLVLWGVHHEVIDRLMSRLADFNPVKVDGRDSSAAREAAIHRFLNDDSCRIWVGQIRAAGVGLTLLNEKTKPCHAIFCETTFVPADLNQAIDRLHRIGQTNKVLARFVVADQVNLDQRVQSILRRKTQEIGALLK